MNDWPICLIHRMEDDNVFPELGKQRRWKYRCDHVICSSHNIERSQIYCNKVDTVRTVGRWVYDGQSVDAPKWCPLAKEMSDEINIMEAL